MPKLKIRVQTTIKGYSKKKGQGNFGMTVGIVKLTVDQRNQLDPLIDNADNVTLTIETVQDDLPYKP